MSFDGLASCRHTLFHNMPFEKQFWVCWFKLKYFVAHVDLSFPSVCAVGPVIMSIEEKMEADGRSIYVGNVSLFVVSYRRCFGHSVLFLVASFEIPLIKTQPLGLFFTRFYWFQSLNSGWIHFFWVCGLIQLTCWPWVESNFPSCNRRLIGFRSWSLQDLILSFLSIQSTIQVQKTLHMNISLLCLGCGLGKSVPSASQWAFRVSCVSSGKQLLFLLLCHKVSTGEAPGQHLFYVQYPQ